MSEPEDRPARDALSYYQDLTPEEDATRTNVHYMLPPRLFEAMTGGRWHTYSCNVWSAGDGGTPADEDGQTASQEAKLDLFARMLDLRPGMRVLDVGSGWGGPLLYLCKRHGIEGHGLTLSERQLAYATEWARREGAACQFHLCHWDHFVSAEPFDAIMTDEVIVHFHRLEDFFRKAWSLLRDDGVMVNKELHFGHPAYGSTELPGARFMNGLYGGTGNYRALADELAMVHRAGFAVEEVLQLDVTRHYAATAAAWRANLRRHRVELEALVGREVYRDYLVYVSLVQSMFSPEVPHRQLDLHLVKSRKLPAELRARWAVEAPSSARRGSRAL